MVQRGKSGIIDYHWRMNLVRRLFNNSKSCKLDKTHKYTNRLNLTTTTKCTLTCRIELQSVGSHSVTCRRESTFRDSIRDFSVQGQSEQNIQTIISYEIGYSSWIMCGRLSRLSLHTYSRLLTSLILIQWDRVGTYMYFLDLISYGIECGV
jgi:hypothetical protein